MLDNNTLDEMKRLIYIGQNKIYQHQERLDALFAFEKMSAKYPSLNNHHVSVDCSFYVRKKNGIW